MKPRYNEKKTTQAASLFLQLSDGEMEYLKLIKLLYIADRQSLLRWGYSISFDKYVSMDYGPVLSQTLNIIRNEIAPWNKGLGDYWSLFIQSQEGHKVKLRRKCAADELSKAERDIIKEVYQDYGQKPQWDIVEELHQLLPEWKNPEGSSLPIEYIEILREGGIPEKKISAILKEIEHFDYVDNLLS